jgi:ribosome-binding protein aMBF1 (putative translation factor)
VTRGRLGKLWHQITSPPALPLELVKKSVDTKETESYCVAVKETSDRRRRPSFDVNKLLADMALRGWNNSDLARAADVSGMTVTRFLRGEAQTAPTAKKLAEALGFTPRRYLISERQEAAAS